MFLVVEQILAESNHRETPHKVEDPAPGGVEVPQILPDAGERYLSSVLFEDIPE